MPTFTVTLVSTVTSTAEVVIDAPDEAAAEKVALGMAESNSSELEWAEDDTDFEVESIEPLEEEEEE